MGGGETRRGARAGLRYGFLAFLAGAVLGPVRELLLAPAMGGLPAALLEAAIMAALLFLAARGVLDRMPPRQGWRARAAVAGVGLAVVLLSEVALDVALEASGIAEARAPRSVAEQAVGLPLLLWLAALPLLLRR
ncbi:hypothetical protein GCM10009416_07880 [Craurococcus roseus]|uniref:Rod shape-determining protein MreD n=1 Tax=Craurococcus roseus TaxID=77585 RepID=A0ABN1EQZ7_9PROT